jgi:hypothetical protein
MELPMLLLKRLVKRQPLQVLQVDRLHLMLPSLGTNIAGSEDATFFSAWDNASAGNFLFSGSITGNAYVAGDTYTIESGSLTASLTLAS